MQGVAGFGVPLAITVPILIKLGFDPAASVAGVLVGHSWSVTFGSMGSSLFTMEMVSGIPAEELAPDMVLMAVIPLLVTGFGVCVFYGGFKAALRGIPYVVVFGAVTAAGMFVAVKAGLLSIIGLIGASFGIAAMLLFNKFFLSRAEQSAEGKRLDAADPDMPKMSLLQAVSPYIIVIIITFGARLLPLGHLQFSFDFPEYTTLQGFYNAAEHGFAKVKLFGHPGPLLLIAAFLAFFVYKHAGVWKPGTLKKICKKTYKKCLGTTITTFFLVFMAETMLTAGMLHALAEGTVAVAGKAYPFISPFIGVLGSFVTSSNTSSNVVFGSFQKMAALNLGLNATLMCAVQSVAGSVGVGLGASQILMGTTAADMAGKEHIIFRKAGKLVLITAFLMGIVNTVLQLVIGYGI
jgi:lactate permease